MRLDAHSSESQISEALAFRADSGAKTFVFLNRIHRAQGNLLARSGIHSLRRARQPFQRERRGFNAAASAGGSLPAKFLTVTTHPLRPEEFQQLLPSSAFIRLKEIDRLASQTRQTDNPAFLLLAANAATFAQQPNQLELKIDPTNRTLTVSAQDEISVDPDVAILHIWLSNFVALRLQGRLLQPALEISNSIINALKQNTACKRAPSTANGSASTPFTVSRTNSRSRSSGPSKSPCLTMSLEISRDVAVTCRAH